jgi:hypothetical protein
MKLSLWGERHRANDWAAAAIERAALVQAARSHGLNPTDEQVKETLREFREEHGLYSSDEATEFLVARGCNIDDFFEAMALLWQERALRARFAEAPAERHFLQHSTEYDRAVLSELVVADENLARELALQVREEGEDFSRLVVHYSTAASRDHAGFLGEIRRRDLLAREAAAVFGADAEIVGPFPVKRGFRLLRVHEVRRAVYSDAVRREIEEQLWREWLERLMEAAVPRITLLSEL